MDLKATCKLRRVISYLIVGIGCSSISNAMAEESLEKRLKKLEEQLEIHKDKKNGKHILNKIRFGGLVQMDYNQYDGAFNAGNDGNTGSDVFVRRVHLRLFHKASNELDYVMLLFANDSSTRFLVGFARYQPNSKTEFRIGKIKEDRSLSVQYIGEEVTAERPMVANAFATGFQWGVQGHRLFGEGFRLSAGIFEDKRYAGDKDGRDSNNSLLLGYNTRGTWSFKENDTVVHIGASYALRDIGKESFSLTERAGIREATNRLAVAPTLESADSASIFMGELAFQQGAFRMEAEYGAMDVDSLVSNTSDLSFSGYYVSASYFLDGKTSLAYNKKYAKFGRPSNENNVWEVYARYSVLDLVDNNAGTKAEVGMLGTTYYLNKHMHFQLQYYDADVSGPATNAAPFTSDDGTQYHEGNAVAARVSYRF
jgi:phosphate-selective porin OprO/OprP